MSKVKLTTNHGDIVASIRRAHGRLVEQAEAEAGEDAQP